MFNCIYFLVSVWNGSLFDGNSSLDCRNWSVEKDNQCNKVHPQTVKGGQKYELYRSDKAKQNNSKNW